MPTVTRICFVVALVLFPVWVGSFLMAVVMALTGTKETTAWYLAAMLGVGIVLAFVVDRKWFRAYL